MLKGSKDSIPGLVNRTTDGLSASGEVFVKTLVSLSGGNVESG